ncbi:tetratricopeptide repeat protein [Flavobacteriaceae bacterium M23B6Z8]
MLKKIFFLLLFILMHLLFAQQEDINQISEKACECIEEVDSNLPIEERTEEVNSCIRSQIIASQAKDLMRKMVKRANDTIASIENIEATDSLVVNENDTLVIETDKNFKELQNYLLENCPATKKLLMTDDQKLTNSVSDNKKAMAFYKKGSEFFSQQKYAQALVQFAKAVKKDRNFAFAWDNMGICHRRLGNYESAIECYQTSLKLDPNGRVPLMNMAVAYELLQDYEKAASTYDRFKEIHKGDPEGPYGAGRMYFQLGDYEKAVDNMFEAYLGYREIESPYISDAEKNIGFFYEELKKIGKLDILLDIAKKYNIEIND